MIKTKKAIKRDARNAEIICKYKEQISVEGAMKSAVYENIAKELKISVTTVSRIANPK